MQKKSCPICKNYKNNKIFSKRKTLKKNKINQFSFSSRKIPEFMNFKLMKCEICNIIFASKVPNFAKIKKFYNDTSYISEQDALDASTTYFKYLKKYLNTKHKINALEIGTGSGLFLIFLKN